MYLQVGLSRSLASQGTVRWPALTQAGLSLRDRPSTDVDFCSLDVFVNGTENNPKLNGYMIEVATISYNKSFKEV